MTQRRHGLWTSALAAAVLLACSTDDSGGAGQGATAASGAFAGTSGVPAAGTSGAPAAGISGAAPVAGTSGAAPVAGTSGAPVAGASGTPAAGASGSPAAGASGTPAAGMGGTDEPASGAGGGDDPAAGAGGNDAPTPTAHCGPATTHSAAELGDPSNLGPFTPTHVERTGPSGSSWVYHPEELGMDGMRHPVFQWGPGAGTGPSNYLDHLNLLASHGFVIISQSSTQSGRQALDWILNENEDPGSMWYQKLDTERVGRGGHSMGALQSMSEADDPRLMLYVLVCGGANGNGGAADIDDATIFLGGEGLGDTRNFEADYAETTGPTVFVRRKNTDHIYCARDNLGPWVAFMRWHFCGEEQWKAEFEPGGAFCMGDWADCETKNL